MPKHYPLGPSAMTRVLACPGSVELAKKAPDVPVSTYAEEGTRAHEVAELFVAHTDLDNVKFGEEYTPEMIAGAKSYLGVVDQIRDEHYLIDEWLERTLVSKDIPDFGGTPDWHAVSADTVFIVDYKYGRGVQVFAEDNAQLLSYFVLAQELHPGAEHYVGVIVQPRLHHIDRVTLTADEVSAFRVEIEAAASGNDTSLNQGDHCRWCPAAVTCPAVWGAVEEAVDGKLSLKQKLDLMPMMRRLLQEVPQLAVQELSNGGAIEGYHLVESMGPREYTVKEEEMINHLHKERRLPKKRILETKLLSPTKMQRAGLYKYVEQFITRPCKGFKVERVQ